MFLLSYLQDISNVSSITNWMQGIGTILGVPGAIAAFILLFKKDIDKENQIEMLTNMVIELSNQTKQFEYQTSLMRESNVILREQVEIQTEALMSDKAYKEKMKEIEIKKNRARFKPHFIYEFGCSTSKVINVSFKNLGERAKILNYIFNEKDEISITSNNNITIEKNGIFNLTGKYFGSENLQKIDRMVEIEYEDSIGTKYKQIFILTGSNAKVMDSVEVIEENK